MTIAKGDNVFRGIKVALLILATFLVQTSAAARIILEEQPDGTVIAADSAKGIRVNGKSYARIRRRIHFDDTNGNVIKTIELDSARETENVPSGSTNKTIVRIKKKKARLADSGDFVGVTEQSVTRVDSDDSDGPVIASSSTFHYFDKTGKELWMRNHAESRFAISKDGKRVGLIEYLPPSPSELADQLEPKHSWIAIYDESGKEVFRYDPGPDSTVPVITLSHNGRYGTSGQVCFDVKTGHVHRPEFKRTQGPGLLTIGDDGKCRIIRYLRDHDQMGRQKTQTVYEQAF